jgi:hypothetical protein
MLAWAIKNKYFTDGAFFKLKESILQKRNIAILRCQIKMQEQKNVAKGEDVIKDNTDQTYGFVDEFLEESIKSSSTYQTDVDVDVNVDVDVDVDVDPDVDY